MHNFSEHLLENPARYIYIYLYLVVLRLKKVDTSYATHFSLHLVSTAEVFVKSSVSVTESAERVTVNCTVINERFVGWFGNKGRPISTLPSKRLHVSTQGSTRYLVITKVNRTDKGTYQCKGNSQTKEVNVDVECKYI